MATISLEEAQSNLPEVIRRLTPGDEVVIMHGNRPAARLIGMGRDPQSKGRQLGTLRGTVLYVAPDFDAPLDDFKEHLE